VALRPNHGESSGDEIVEQAWRSLPPAHRQLLESIGASQCCVVSQPLGDAISEFRRSGGHRPLTRAQRAKHNEALAIWDKELRVVLINEAHPKLTGLDAATREQFLSRLAWHEWAHALSIERCSDEDIRRGRELLELAPQGIREGIRTAGYRPKDYTHEIIAETYALLMSRRLRQQVGRPEWLNDRIYHLLTRVTGWTE
jgi:PAS domain-containing protein